MTETYQFKREDNGEVVEVDFPTMMTMDILGCITLPCGASARRVRTVTLQQAERIEELEKPVLSDALGFCEAQFNDFELDRVKNGFRGVEFVRDPKVPQFFQVKITSKAEWARYVKHRGFGDRNSRNGSGASVSAVELERLKHDLLAKYPTEKKVDPFEKTKLGTVDVR